MCTRGIYNHKNNIHKGFITWRYLPYVEWKKQKNKEIEKNYRDQDFKYIKIYSEKIYNFNKTGIGFLP